MNIHNSFLKIVIAHEDLVTGIEAAAVLRRLAAQIESEFSIKSDAWQIGSSLWKFEMLQEPELREQALAEAVAADMIIISVGTRLPACVMQWIEKALPMKKGGPAALVALLDRVNPFCETEAFCPETYFRRLAGQYGLDFFCNTDDQTRHISSGIESIVSRCERRSTNWKKPFREIAPFPEEAMLNLS
jgi:hypothetical protein